MNEKSKEMDLFETLNVVRDKYLSAQKKEEKIYKEMKDKVKESTKRIELSYQEKINLAENNCSILKKELENYEKLIENYSTFDSKMIGEIIAKLVSIVEGERYFYQKATHETYERETTYFGSELFKVNKKILMIVKGNRKQEYYYDNSPEDNEVRKLIKSGQAFVLTENEYYFYKTIKFYEVNDGIVKGLINFNKFSCVEDFIDLVIQYRFENNLEKITETELLHLMKQFVLSKKEMIEGNYQKRLLEKQEALRQQLAIEQLNCTEELSQIELEDLLQNGVPSRHNNNLIDRLHETVNNNADFNNMCQLEILYDGGKHNAKLTCDDPLISLENIFISKINIESSIKDYFDCTDPDPHFHGFCDIDLVDDGLVGIVDISNLKQDLNDIITVPLQYKEYKIDRINDKYLRILYLPNKGEYKHKPTNVYSWILEEKSNENNENLDKKPTSYRIEWNSAEETEKMLTYLKEIELLSNLDEKQLKLYKRRKK